MRHSILILFLIIAASCKQARPDDVIQPDVMQKMLTDLHYAETYSVMINDSLHQIRNKNLDSLALYYESIQAHYGISNESFLKSVDWYKNNPEVLDSAYATMILRVSETEAALQKN